LVSFFRAFGGDFGDVRAVFLDFGQTYPVVVGLVGRGMRLRARTRL
jgi:hypothetical protein